MTISIFILAFKITFKFNHRRYTFLIQTAKNPPKQYIIVYIMSSINQHNRCPIHLSVDTGLSADM